MPRLTPAARIRMVEALTSLQKLRREMGRLSEMDEDYRKKKRVLKAVIKELQCSLRDGEYPLLCDVSSSDRLGKLSRNRNT